MKPAVVCFQGFPQASSLLISSLFPLQYSLIMTFHVLREICILHLKHEFVNCVENIAYRRKSNAPYELV